MTMGNAVMPVVVTLHDGKTYQVRLIKGGYEYRHVRHLGGQFAPMTDASRSSYPKAMHRKVADALDIPYDRIFCS